MTPCRLIVDPPQDGAWNMAVDESLLEDAAERGVASLRFYQWREPTLSLGYFQTYRDQAQHPASAAAAVVRRLSGGGALLHDRELTYSLCRPASHQDARRSPELYEAAHRSLIDALSAHGAHLAIFEDLTAKLAATGDQDANEPFLCFARRTAADIVVLRASAKAPTAKVVGSAQRRRRGAVLQHGGVLLETSPFAPELPGLSDSTGVRLTAEELLRDWQPKLAAALELALQPQPLGDALRQSAQRLRAEKYGLRSWIERR
jgi:lipoate-protein ligase A